MLGQEMTVSIFGTNLRKRREAAGVSGNQLAARANIDQSAISKIENGKRRPSKPEMQRLVDDGGIGLTIEELKAWAQADRILDEIKKLPRDKWGEVLEDVETVLRERGVEG